MISLDPFARLVALDHGLTVVTTRRADTTPQATVVNAGVLTHPTNGRPAVAFVAAGASRKLVHLRADPLAVLTIRGGMAVGHR